MVAWNRRICMTHFLSIADLSQQEVEHLLQRAFFFKQAQQFPSYPHHILANLFYENSTRTRISFELAARHLSIGVVNVDLSTSSEMKGEGIHDTLQTLAVMGISLFAIRHSEDGLPAQMAKGLSDGVH